MCAAHLPPIFPQSVSKAPPAISVLWYLSDYIVITHDIHFHMSADISGVS